MDRGWGYHFLVCLARLGRFKRKEVVGFNIGVVGFNIGVVWTGDLGEGKSAASVVCRWCEVTMELRKPKDTLGCQNDDVES